MKLGADAAPHYMVASGRVRLINYKDSKDVLQESLKTISTDHLRKLLQDLKNIKETLFKNDTIAFIGASIILIKTAEGEIKPYLIDPAHIIVRPATPDEPPRQPVDANIKIYYGNPTTDDFQKQHDSNQIAMRSLMDSVIELLNERTDQNPEQPPEAPQDPQLVGAQQQSLLLNLQDDYKPVHHPEN
jgi:hypothetical protein